MGRKCADQCYWGLNLCKGESGRKQDQRDGQGPHLEGYGSDAKWLGHVLWVVNCVCGTTGALLWP